MLYTGFIKRILSFALTFAAGLFIASFFMPIGMPGSRHRERRQNEMREMRIEVEQLRKEKCELRRQLEEAKSNPTTWEEPLNLDGDAEMMAPVPPPVPVAPHRHR